MAMKDWSTTAASNATVGTITWAEGQLPSTVNDSARQLMADVRSWTDDGAWHTWGDSHTYASATSTAVSGDVTARYHAGRAIRAVGSSTGTIYGKVSSSSYSAPDTTINYTWDSGSLASEALTISVGFVQVTGKPIDVSGVREAVSRANVQASSAVYAADTGAADAYAMAPTPAITAYAAGQRFIFKAANANTGASTLAVSGLAVQAIKKQHDVALAAGDIEAGSIVEVVYDGTNFQMMTPSAAVSGAAGDVFGPASATNSGIVLFDGTSGKLLKDSTYTITAAGAAILDDANAAAQATTLGLGTGDSPQFTAVNIGHATDTTISRVSAGVIAVEGSTVATLSGVQTFADAVRGTETALTSSSASIAIDLSASNFFTHTFTENTTIANPSNIVAGQEGVIVFTQHASSPKTLAFGSYWDFPGGTTPTITATNSAVDVLAYYVISSTKIVAKLLADVK